MGTPFPPGFSGIDPDLMADMIKEFRRGRADITGALASYRSRLPALGVDVSPLSYVDRVCAWIDEQLPMLTRRKDLAVALDDSSERGLASVDESLIVSPADARRQGTILAVLFKSTRLDEGAYHDVLNELGMHRFDADYAAAFFAALGPELTGRLPSLIKKYAREGHADRQLRETSQAFGSAVSGGMDVPKFNSVAKAMFETKMFREERQGVASLVAYGTFPPEWLASLARVHALDPAYRRLSSGLSARSDLTGTDWESIREMLRALSNNPAAARLAFQGTAEANPRPTGKSGPYLLPSKPEPDLGHVISTFTRLSVFDEQAVEQLGRALAAGSGAYDEKDGAHSREAGRFAFTVMTTLQDKVPDGMQIPMSQIAGAYATEIAEGANIDDRNQDTAFGKVKSYTPGLKPMFSLSPQDTYAFLKTFADSPEHMKPFEQGMGALARSLGAEGIRIETAKAKGRIRHDAPGLERVMQALGYVAGLQSQAQRTVQGDLDEQDAKKREQLRALMDAGIDVGSFFVPSASVADEVVWEFFTKQIGQGADAYMAAAGKDTRLKRLENKELQMAIGLQHAVVQRLIERGYPIKVSVWNADHPHPGYLFYNNENGHLYPWKEIKSDPRLLDNYIAWLNANGRGGDSEDAFGQVAVNAMNDFRGAYKGAVDKILEWEQESKK